MQQSTLRVHLVTGVLLIALSQSLNAKAPTVRLTITGAELPDLIETSDPAALANIWAGIFIGGPAEEPDRSLPRYLVMFSVRWSSDAGDTIEPKYVVRYVHDPRTARGFVYLPGRGEGGYAMNARSMLRDGQDGRWHRADPRWSDALVRALSARSSAPRR